MPEVQPTTQQLQARDRWNKQFLNRTFSTHPEPRQPKVPKSKGIERAQEAAQRRIAKGKVTSLFDARLKLRHSTASQAIALLRTLPAGVLQLYLYAEDTQGGRKLILDKFGKPGPEQAEKYGSSLEEVLALERAENQEEAVEPPESVEAKAAPAKSPAKAKAKAVPKQANKKEVQQDVIQEA